MKTAVYTRANRAPRAPLSHRALHNHSLESLESRQLFATYNLSDYFPTSTGSTWTYSGTSSGNGGSVAATGTLSFVSSGGNVVETFSSMSGGLAGVFSRTLHSSNGGLNVVQTDRQLASEDYLDVFSAGYNWLPSTFTDGSSPLSTFNSTPDNLTRTVSNSIAFDGAGAASGTITVSAPTTLVTPAGTFQAIQIQELSNSSRTSGSNTISGTYNLSMWLVKGLGIARMSLTATETANGAMAPFSTVNYDVSLTSTTFADINANVGLKGNGNAIPNGSSLPVRTNNTAFGVLDVNGATVNKTFTITNTGTQALHLGNDSGLAVTIAGANAGDFTLLAQPQLSGPTLAPGASTTFTIRFNPSGAGLRNALVTVNTRSLTNSPYTFDVRGTGQYFGILGIQGGVNPATINSGATTASFANGTRFGSVIGDGAHGFARRFIVNNSGTGLTNFTGSPKIVLSGFGAGDFVITVDPASTLGAGGQTIFRIRFLPQSAGFKKAFVSIANDSSNASPFTFAITGTGV